MDLILEFVYSGVLVFFISHVFGNFTISGELSAKRKYLRDINGTNVLLYLATRKFYFFYHFVFVVLMLVVAHTSDSHVAIPLTIVTLLPVCVGIYAVSSRRLLRIAELVKKGDVRTQLGFI